MSSSRIDNFINVLRGVEKMDNFCRKNDVIRTTFTSKTFMGIHFEMESPIQL